MSTLLTYDHPHSGATEILVETPGLPVTITLRDNPNGIVQIELAGARANTVQVGPFGPRNQGVRVRALDEEQGDLRKVLTTILPGAVSQTARVSGNSTVVQCGGDMTFGGHGREDGTYISAPLDCLFRLKGYKTIGVHFEGEDLTVAEAAARGLLRLPS